jgi:nucleotide-binding universal stress UspA family protein
MKSVKQDAVLLVLSSEDKPADCLRRAAMFARTRSSTLHVLRVVPGRSARRNDPVRAMRETVHLLRLLAATRRWVHDVTGQAISSDRVRVGTGKLVELAARRAKEIGAALVVVPPLDGRFGSRITALASRARVPVLVERGVGGRESVLAATDLQDSRYPVLVQAASLSRQLDLPLVTLHNLNPRLGVSRTPASNAATSTHEDAWRAMKAQLELASRGLAERVETVVADELNPVSAILREARAREADYIVVGTRPRSWLARLAYSSVAADIVNATQRSVLVAPVHARHDRRRVIVDASMVH